MSNGVIAGVGNCSCCLLGEPDFVDDDDVVVVVDDGCALLPIASRTRNEANGGATLFFDF